MSKPRLKSTTTAYATVKVKVRCGSYGPECQMDQILRQAAQEAENFIRQRIQNDTSRATVLQCDVVDVVTHVERT